MRLRRTLALAATTLLLLTAGLTEATASQPTTSSSASAVILADESDTDVDDAEAADVDYYADDTHALDAHATDVAIDAHFGVRGLKLLDHLHGEMRDPAQVIGLVAAFEDQHVRIAFPRQVADALVG